MKRYIGQNIGEGCRNSILSPSAPPSQHLGVFTPQKFSKPHCLGFLWRFCDLGMIDNALAVS